MLEDKDILKSLVDQILNFAADPNMEKRKKNVGGSSGLATNGKSADLCVV